MKQPDEAFLDGLLKILSEAPRTQIDEDIVADVKKFMGEVHTRDEKYAFIQGISREPLNKISEKVGVGGRITPLVQLACDLDKMFGDPQDGKYSEPVKTITLVVVNERITIDQIVSSQEKEKQQDIMKDIFIYMDDLMWANQFKKVDEFIEKFCERSTEICFQYHICLLTCASWAVDKLDNIGLLRTKAIEAGTKEYGKAETLKILKGLL